MQILGCSIPFILSLIVILILILYIDEKWLPSWRKNLVLFLLFALAVILAFLLNEPLVTDMVMV